MAKIRLTEVQKRAMDKISYGRSYEVKSVTLRSLRDKGLIETTKLGFTVWTDAAFELFGVEKPKPSEDILRVRALQDSILEIVEKKRIPTHFSVSGDMPSEITIEKLYYAVYDKYEDVLRGVLYTLKTRYNIAS